MKKFILLCAFSMFISCAPASHAGMLPEKFYTQLGYSNEYDYWGAAAGGDNGVTLNDRMFNALGKWGFTGSLNERLLAWVRYVVGSDSGSIADNLAALRERYKLGTVYFVDSSADAGGDGKSFEVIGDHAPFKTIAQVNAATFNPGDVIAFRRGDTWREVLECWHSGTATAPIIYTNFGSGNLPIIRGSDAVAAASWTADGANWYWQPPVNEESEERVVPMQVWENDTRLTWKTAVAGIDGNGQWAWDAVNSRVYIRPLGGSITGKTFEVGQRCSGIFISHTDNVRAKDSNHHVIIDGLQVEKVAARGDNHGDHVDSNGDFLAYSVVVSHGYSCIVRNCTIKQMGGGKYYAPGTTSNWSNAIEFWNSYDCKAEYNTVYDGRDAGIDTENLLTGATVGYEATHNTIYDIDGVGLLIDKAGGYFAYNSVDNCGGSHTTGSYQRGVYFMATQKLPCVFEYNIITDCPSVAGIRGYGTGGELITVRNNIIVNCGAAIYATNGSNNWDIYHNTFVDIPVDGFVIGLVSNTSPTHVIKNNIFINPASPYIYTDENTTTFDYNSYYGCTSDTKFTWNSTNYTTIAAYRTASSQDAHSIAADPKLNADYTLQSDSPCINAGTDVGVTTDYAGTLRSNPPSIGAYE